jgi:hypothetical protein
MAGGNTLYCAGLPLEGERPLTPGERDRAAALRRAFGVRALARLALVPVALAAAVAVAAMTRGASGRAAEVLAASAIVAVGLVGPIVAIVHALRAGASWRALGRDLAGGVALRFAGGGRSVAVLPRAGFPLEWDGAPAAAGPRLAIGEAAAVPREVATYAVDIGTARAAPGFDVVRRALSSAERDEIAGHARRLGRLPAVLVVFTASFLVLSARELRGVHPAEPGSGVLVAVWASFLAYAWWRFFRALALARKLRDDVSNGWALRATAGGPAGNEVLPVSGAAWTVQGAPAPWRTHGPRTRER